MKKILQVLSQIKSLDSESATLAKIRLDNLTKPPGSLAALENLTVTLAGILNTTQLAVLPKAIVLMAADHGVAIEGVSAYPQQVTEQMVYNFVRGGAAINVLSRHAGAELVLVDVGVAAELSPELPIKHAKVRRGTENIRRHPAMSRDELLKAIEVGIDTANELADKGIQIIGLGEMGIGNTTASSAVASVLLNREPTEVTGVGAGISSDRLVRKIEIIAEAIRLHQPMSQDPLDVLAKVGGLEIAALTGLVLAGAARRMLVVLDGFISTAAVLAAYRIEPAIKPFLLASHLSAEPGHEIILTELGLKPCLRLDMRLGEGTGAALGMTLIDASVKIFNEMATFEQAKISGALENSEDKIAAVSVENLDED